MNRLKAFIDKPVSHHLLAHISHQASLVIPCHHLDYKSVIPPLPTFVSLLVKRSYARTGTLLATLVLLDRLRQRLAQFARGMPCTCQRIFLATLIVTTKVLHDTCPKNKHWTKYAVYFSLPEINLMEKQLLSLMNYQVIITEQDLLNSFMNYDHTIRLQLPPILTDRLYMPKSASSFTIQKRRKRPHLSNSSISYIEDPMYICSFTHLIKKSIWMDPPSI